MTCSHFQAWPINTSYVSPTPTPTLSSLSVAGCRDAPAIWGSRGWRSHKTERARVPKTAWISPHFAPRILHGLVFKGMTNRALGGSVAAILRLMCAAEAFR